MLHCLEKVLQIYKRYSFNVTDSVVYNYEKDNYIYFGFWKITIMFTELKLLYCVPIKSGSRIVNSNSIERSTINFWE